MKTFLIAAGLMATMLGVTPAVAAPAAGNAPGIEAPQSRGDWRDNRRDDRGMDRRDDRGDRRMDRRDDRRGDHWNNGRRDGRQDRWNNGRGNRWGWNARRCHNERHHGHWVRVCGRNWR
jgi:hypothetical protein